jgi:glutamate carboxypeptidase
MLVPGTKKREIINFLPYFDSQKGKMVDFLREAVKLESPTSDKKAVDACSLFFIRKLRKIGAKITRFPQKKTGDLFLAQYPPESKKTTGQLLLLTHTDTVWPKGKIQKMHFYVSGKKVFGPGALDMKAGLVIAVFSLQALEELNVLPKKRIALFINSCEETGSEASNKAIRNLAKRSSCVLCLEPGLPGGGLKIQRKGRLVVRLETRGKAAHAGTPDKGISAIDELMLQLQAIKKLETKQTTINIGLICGGEKPNIVPERARAVLDIRFWQNDQKEKIIVFLSRLSPMLEGARIKFSLESLTPPMERTKANLWLFSQARRTASSLGMELYAGKSGGGSDASIASSLGIPTLDGLGPDGDGIHAEHEHLILPSFIERAALLTELLIQL